jgi:ribosomal protein S18 acetylase RimI-like enzyme
MSQFSIVLRPAAPTLEEGRAFARYLDQATEGFFRLMLGRRAVDILAAAYAQPDHELSYQYAIFAERDGVIVGMASGYTAEQHRRSSVWPLRQAAGRSAPRMGLVRAACAPLLGFLGSHTDGDFYLQAIAVDEGHRGEGFGAALFDASEERARGSGASRFSLDVSPKNKRARGLYERRGMVVESRWPKSRLMPPVVLRMTKPL